MHFPGALDRPEGPGTGTKLPRKDEATDAFANRIHSCAGVSPIQVTRAPGVNENGAFLGNSSLCPTGDHPCVTVSPSSTEHLKVALLVLFSESWRPLCWKQQFEERQTAIRALTRPSRRTELGIKGREQDPRVPFPPPRGRTEEGASWVTLSSHSRRTREDK